MARKKGNKKNNRRKLLTQLSRGGFTKKEVKRVSRKLNIKPKKAKRITSRFTKKSSSNINRKVNFKNTSSNKGPLKINSSPRVKNIQKEADLLGIGGTLPPTPTPTPRPRPRTIPEQIKDQAPNLTGPKTPTPTQTSFQDNEALLKKLMGEYDNTAYLNQITDLQSTIQGLEGVVGGYQTELNTLGDKYRDMDLEQAKFKAGDSQYLSGNNSRGVRLRRSKNKNLFALGTGQFNRKNRTKNLAIGNVNL